jgi:pimeloyl-ACP methyl ester carboxylesterase
MTSLPDSGVASRHAAVAQAPRAVRTLFALMGRLSTRSTAKWVLKRMLTPKRRHTGREASWPAPVRFAVSCRGRSIQCYRWGEVGPLALLVHGWEGRATDLGEFVAPLLHNGFCVLTFDAPAHGESDGAQTDVLDMAESIDAVLGGSMAAVVVAHSIGCAATAEWMLQRPGGIERLAVIAPGGDLADEIDQVAKSIGLPLQCTTQLKALMEEHYRRPLSRCSTASALATSAIPLLVIHDRDDRVVSFRHGARIAESVAGARLLPTIGLGHRRILHEQSVIGDTVRFLAAM